MTALVMFLPHIPSTTSHHLPALFNIYTRILFWDRQKINEDGLVPMVKEEDKNMNIDGWKKLPCLLEFNDESVPQLLYYFTFLYGLYPINFMSYVRKPQKYLGHAKFSGTEEFEIQPWEVRQRSESFRQIHRLHPNFFTFTLESELTDNNRWRRSDAADVVAECMALYVPSEDLREQVLKHKGKKNNPESLFSGLLSLDEKRTPIPRIRRASWSDVQSKIGLSTSKIISQPCFSRKFSLDTFPHVSLEGLSDSVAVPQTIGSTSSTELGFDRPPRSNIYLMKDAIASLALSNHHESQIDSYLESLSRVSKPTASTDNPEVSEPSSSISQLPHLYREIQLLKNDLNFERYLKQQHLSHIGQLRRKQIREARIEAETQNVITSNRTLKLKLEEAKRLNTQLKRESEKSKSHCRKWEAELSTKLRSLREEQRKWITERENLTQDLKIATQNISIMRQIIIQTEARELRAQQKAAYAEGSLEELQQLRKEVKELNLRVRIYEVNEEAVKAAKKNEDTAEARVIMLEAELQARDREFVEAQKTFEQEISNLRKQSWSGPKSTSPTRQKLQDMSLAMPNTQIIELQKNYDQLLARYLALQNDFYNLQAYTSKRNDLDNVANNDDVS
ncbi:hypothetical protein K3495_g1686 [Podosphaera aphanis]|nr:hypothetical protein K3495_g1686 [Podosphaera aphanis]